MRGREREEGEGGWREEGRRREGGGREEGEGGRRERKEREDKMEDFHHETAIKLVLKPDP